MKTIFKRAAATATGSVLLLSQLAATAVVNFDAAAADTTAMDKAWVIDVPVEETLKVTAITDGSTVNKITSSVEAGESQWNKDFETAILAIAGSGAVSTTASAAGVKTAIENALASTSIIDAATAAELVAGISDEANVTVDDGEAVITIDCAEIGAAAGKVIEEMVRRGGCSLKDDNDNAIAIDWSAFSVKGTATVKATYTYDKNIAYAVSFTDEKGATYTPDTIDQYMKAKINEAEAIIGASILKAAAAAGVTEVSSELVEFQSRSTDYPERIMNTLKALYGVSVSGTELDATYADYLAAAEAAVSTRVAAQIEKKAPATITGALYNNRADNAIDSVIASLNSVAGANAEISITATDLADIVTSGYDYSIEIPNGVSADLVFSIEDDQNADLLAALQEIDPLVATVVSHKEITLNVDNKADGTGNIYYNVVRVIDEITKKEESTTTTTVTTTTTTESTTTTTSTSESESTTTTTSTSESESTTTTTSTSESESTTTTTSTSESESTTTTTSTSESESTTTTTSTSESVSTTTTSGTTTTTSGTTTTTSGTTTTTSGTTTTTTTGSTTTTSATTTTTTAPNYEIQINAEGLKAEKLVYWSEEDIDFEVSGLKVTADIYVNGELDATIDVTNAYAPNATKPSDINFIGFGSYEIDAVLTDEAAIKQAITDAGYDVSKFDATALTAGAIPTGGQMSVILVLRGDVTLDNKIDTLDALGALQYYADIELSHLTPQTTIDHGVILKGQDGDVNYLPYVHYAADVMDGNGKLSLLDAFAILRYYADIELSHFDGVTWETETGSVVVPQYVLHADPLANDEVSKTFYNANVG